MIIKFKVKMIGGWLLCSSRSRSLKMAVIMRLIRSVNYQQPVERNRTTDIAIQHDTGRPQTTKIPEDWTPPWRAHTLGRAVSWAAQQAEGHRAPLAARQSAYGIFPENLFLAPKTWVFSFFSVQPRTPIPLDSLCVHRNAHTIPLGSLCIHRDAPSYKVPIKMPFSTLCDAFAVAFWLANL